MKQNGIEAAVIGKITDGNNGLFTIQRKTDI